MDLKHSTRRGQEVKEREGDLCILAVEPGVGWLVTSSFELNLNICSDRFDFSQNCLPIMNMRVCAKEKLKLECQSLTHTHTLLPTH